MDALFPAQTQIRTATADDIKFILHVEAMHPNCLGFIPRAGLEVYLDRRLVKLAFENGDACGYLLGNEALRWNIAIRPITQAAIAFDAQRRHHGLALVAATEASAVAA